MTLADKSHMQPIRLESLQILRFFAAMAVVLFHANTGLAQEYPGTPTPFAFGFSGVDVFFVLSGFIMAYTVDPTRGSLDFIQRRVARIVPLYWFLTTGLIGIAIVLPQLLNTTEVNAEAIWKSYFFIPYEKPNGAVQPILFLGWTLCYEMYFYALYALAILTGKHASWVVCGMLVMIVLGGAALPADNVLWHFYTNPITLEFIAGILLFYLYRNASWMRFGSPLAALGLLTAATTLYIIAPNWPRFLALGIPATLIVAAFLCIKIKSKGWILPTLILLGDASYALYLSHPYILQLPVKLLSARFSFTTTIAALSVAITICLIISIFLFYLIEKPSQRFLLRLFRRKPKDIIVP